MPFPDRTCALCVHVRRNPRPLHRPTRTDAGGRWTRAEDEYLKFKPDRTAAANGWTDLL